jgi:polyferredoxin
MVSLFLGRAFCGWVCPGAGIQEWCFTVNDKKARGGRLNWIKYFIWVPWIRMCKICDKNCPMSLEVSRVVQSGSMKNTECILCGVCVDNCSQGVIKYVREYGKQDL